MTASTIRARRPLGELTSLVPIRDPDVIGSHLEDAAHFAGGHATEWFAPASEADIAEILRRSRAVLPIGAQSSLTGGATPFGETLLSTHRLDRIEDIGTDRVRVQAGVILADLDAALARANRYYPPAPTFTGAFVGGTVATNAAGAATFKYGATRPWVERLTVVLAGGDVLDLTRGATRAHSDGYFDLDLSSGRVRVPVPSYVMPLMPKLSAGYFAEPAMDLIDLFIGSEGTLGIITEVTLRVLATRPAMCLAFVPFRDRSKALTFVRRLRDAATATWRSGDPHGMDISAIEHLDARCLALLREDGADIRNGIELPPDAAIGLLVTLELASGTTARQAYDEIGRAADPVAPDTPLVRFCGLLGEFGVLDRAAVAVPGDQARIRQLLNLREAVPDSVNRRVGRAKREVDDRIEKTAADMIVPFDRLASLLDFYEEELRRRGLDAAIWGHISDGNLHPNVIPRTFGDVEAGRAAILAFGREAVRLGGAPLAEHGVGRNATKQALLLELYGERGIDEMRRVKAALDPEGKLAPGVIFPRILT